ncbi:MAG: response regulator [Acidobacteriales bacterium]|nr:response regulator [Terriglobales bacterium]
MLPRLKPLLLGAGALLVAHALTMILAPDQTPADKANKILASNLFQIMAAAAAAYFCWRSSRSRSGLVSRFWTVTALVPLLWVVAQIIWTIGEYRSGFIFFSQNATLFLFFFSFAPFVYLILIRSEIESRQLDWIHALDVLQVVVVLVCIFLWQFYLPFRYETYEQTSERMLDHVFMARNFLLVVLVWTRVMISRSRLERSLFLHASLFVTVYMLGSRIPTWARLKWDIGTGTWLDLFWTLPFLMLALSAASWKEEPGAEHQVPEEGWRAALAVYLLPSVIPLLILVMAARIAREQLASASVAIVVSFVLFAVRLAITQQRQRSVSNALQEAEGKFQILFHQNPQPIWVEHRDSHHFLEVNDAAVRKYGYSREEFLGMTTGEIQQDAGLVRLVETTMERGVGPRVRESRHLCKDGRAIEVRILGESIDFAGAPAELAIIEDISDRKRLEERLRQAQKMEAVGTLAGGIAHDFNNLLTVILGYAQVASDRASGDEALTREMKQIEGAASRATALIRQLLAFSRRQVMQPEVIHLEMALGGIEKMLKKLLGEHVDLVIRRTGEVGLVKADPGQMEQVLINLVMNARDAMVGMTSGGKLLIELQNVTLDEEFAREHIGARPGDYVMMAVSDNGNGMEESTLTRIFEPFFTTKGSMGTGLGLPTVYGIVEQSGGTITVTSRPGRGSTFRIFLPRIHGEVAPTARAEMPAMMQNGVETILLVEDDEGLRELARRVLANRGYRVLEAASGADGERVCREFDGNIDLLLTDVVMPGLSGKELAAKVRQMRPEIGVIYMSGYTDEVVLRQGIQEGSANFVQKPFTPTALSQKVREVLDARKAAVPPR